MREREIEKQLRIQTEKRGGLCLKFVSPSCDGVPDRILFLPDGKVGLVETKAPGGTPRPLQAAIHRMFGRIGHRVYVLDGVDQIGGVLDEIQST